MLVWISLIVINGRVVLATLSFQHSLSYWFKWRWDSHFENGFHLKWWDIN